MKEYIFISICIRNIISLPKQPAESLPYFQGGKLQKMITYRIPNRFRSSSGEVMPPMPNCSTSTLATLGERKAGKVGPRWICFTPRLSKASRTMTAFCSYQAMLYTMGSSLISFNWKTSFSFRAMTASE